MPWVVCGRTHRSVDTAAQKWSGPDSQCPAWDWPRRCPPVVCKVTDAFRKSLASGNQPDHALGAERWQALRADSPGHPRPLDKCLSSSESPFPHPQQGDSSTILPILVSAHPTEVFLCVYLMRNEVEHIFRSLLAIWIPFFVTYLGFFWCCCYLSIINM